MKIVLTHLDDDIAKLEAENKKEKEEYDEVIVNQNEWLILSNISSILFLVTERVWRIQEGKWARQEEN